MTHRFYGRSIEWWWYQAAEVRRLAGNYVVRGSEATFNGQEFVVDVYSATGGFLKFKGKSEQPDRRVDLVFPKDLRRHAPHSGTSIRASAPRANLVNEPKDPWSACIELPLVHRESGEPFTFTAQ